MSDAYAALVLIGPPGSGKSFLGAQLAARSVAAYTELEPLFASASGAARRSKASSARRETSCGAPTRRSAAVRASRALCVERVVTRSPEKNLHATTDRERAGRHYDLWQERVAATFRFDLRVDGDDVESAVAAVRRLLGRGR